MDAEGRLISVQIGLPQTLGLEGAPDPMDQPWTTGLIPWINPGQPVF